MDWSLILNKIVIPAAITVGAYFWTRFTTKKEEKKENRSLLDDIVENLIYELLDVYPLNVPVETYLKNSRAYINKYVWSIASKRGIPRNKTTEKLLNLAIERGTKLLAQEITKLKNYNQQLRNQH